VIDAVVEIPADTWFDGWRAHARPQRGGRRFIVTPPWRPADAGPDDLVLYIDPGRAFGSGAHPSTRLVLAELEALVRRGATVLDLGSGSGVLSIAAIRLGAASVCAVDIDPAATEATVANAARNDVDGAVTVTDRMPDGPFDLAVANIGANALITLAPALVSRAAAVVLAGFLDERADEVAAAYAAAGSPVAGRRGLEGWTALTCVRSRR
jgi:ribosomal protein L11 methyltransferase